MLRLFQPGVLFVLVCAFFLGMSLPLNFDKPRFLTPTKKSYLETEEATDSARQLYDNKLNKIDIPKNETDWFQQVPIEITTRFLPNELNELNYSSSGILNVPKIFLEKVPVGLDELPVEQKKAIFIRFMLPLILKANQEIWGQRQDIIKANNSSNKTALKSIAKAYKIDTDIMKSDDIYGWANNHVLPIPTSLALAQAAIESGWGTSRFSIEGNALFGQWSWSPQSGIKPLEASNSNAVVRSFPNLQSSVHSYMKNLNTHPAYKEFRTLRKSFINQGKWPDSVELATGLHPYAETGDHYVKSIINIISQNNLQRFDYSKLLIW